MKTILLTTIALLIGTAAQAEIQNTQYDARHQAMLEKAVAKACNNYNDARKLVQISSSVVKHKVDQGITDLYFTTELELTIRIDQGVYDIYTVKAKTLLADAYDHTAQDWGIYSVESISCEMQ